MEVDRKISAFILTYIPAFERTFNGFGTCYTSINNDVKYNTDKHFHLVQGTTKWISPMNVRYLQHTLDT